MGKPRSEVRADVMGEIVEMIADELVNIKRYQGGGNSLSLDQSRILAEFGRTMSVIDRNMKTGEKENEAVAKGMTDAELDAEVLKAAKEIEARRGSGPPHK